ncbi:MAG: murE [Herbinix sp.]|nr:murE [Herbinix sp.]
MNNNCISLQQLLEGVASEVITEGNSKDINDIKINSKLIQEGNMYIALKGEKNNGHSYLKEAYDRGAKFLVINKEELPELDISSLSDATIIAVNNTRVCLSQLINNFYSHPTKKFKLIGVTGTNGKTSITTIANHFFMKLGFHTGLIGTIDNYINNEKMNIEKTTPTTPDCVELGKIMNLFVREKVDVALMEVSSMALKTHRVDGCQFDIAVFSNISPEHLDNHKTMEDYVNSKLLLFDMVDKAVVNVDDAYSDQVLDRCQGEIIRYGIKNGEHCDIYAKNIIYSNEGVSFMAVFKKDIWHGHSLSSEIELPLSIGTPSEFAVYNYLAAIGICMLSGFTFEHVVQNLQDEIYIEGRYDVIKAGQPFTAVVDYAHTPAALENLLTAAHKNEQNKRIITVFGCGGDRDKSKRGPMGKVCQQLSDITILTLDNPRTEKPDRIIDDILSGMDKNISNYVVIPERKEAIEYAIRLAKADDIVIIAGKGHEKIQIFNGYSIEFDDRKVAENAIKGLKNNNIFEQVN